jgi:hypothetical protein
VVPVRRADEAVRDLLDLRITRYPHVVAHATNLATASQPFCLRCCLHCVCRKTRSCTSDTGCSTRFCFGPWRSHRALLIRRIASLAPGSSIFRRGTQLARGPISCHNGQFAPSASRLFLHRMMVAPRICTGARSGVRF